MTARVRLLLCCAATIPSSLRGRTGPLRVLLVRGANRSRKRVWPVNLPLRAGRVGR